MPPVLFAALSYPFTRLAHFLFPAAVANGIIAGAYVFCECYAGAVVCTIYTRILDVLYDVMHYA